MATRRLNILIGARDRASRVLRAIGRSASALGKRFALVGGAAAGLAAVGLGLLIRSQLKTIDSTAKLADILGLTSEQLVGYQRAAELTGVDTNALGKAFARMQKNIGDAVDGLSTAQLAFDQLGVTTDELLALNTDEQFKLIADRLREIEQPAIRTQVALNLFGKAGLQIIKLAEVGSVGLTEFQKRTAELGATFNRLDAAKVEAANDALSDMKLAFIGIGRTLAIALAPTIQQFADNTTNAVAAISKIIRKSMNEWQEIGVRAFTRIEFAATNWRDVVKLAFASVQLKISEFQDDVAISIAAAFEIAVFKSKEILLRFRVFWDGFIADFFTVRQSIIDSFAGTLAGFVLKFKRGLGQITEDEFQAALKALPGQLEGIEMLRAAQAKESAKRRIAEDTQLNKDLLVLREQLNKSLALIADQGASKRTQDLEQRIKAARSVLSGADFESVVAGRLDALAKLGLGQLAQAAIAGDVGRAGGVAGAAGVGGPARGGGTSIEGRFITGVAQARAEEDRSLSELEELNKKQLESNTIASRALLVLEGLSTSVRRGQPLMGSGLGSLA